MHGGAKRLTNNWNLEQSQPNLLAAFLVILRSIPKDARRMEQLSSSPSIVQYQYSPLLEADKEIRLAVIQPGSFEDDIRVSFELYQLLVSQRPY